MSCMLSAHDSRRNSQLGRLTFAAREILRCAQDDAKGEAKLLRLPLLLFAVMIGTAIAQTTTTVTHHRVVEADSSAELARAEAALEKKDYAAAQPLLENISAANPANYQVWFDLGFLYHAQGKAAGSIAAYRKAVAANPDIFESNLSLGLTLAQAGNPEAESFLRAATKLKPVSHPEENQARAWVALADVIEASKPDEALAAYRQAELFQPRDPGSYFSAGALLQKQNRWQDASDEYQKVLKLDPSSSDALINLANIDIRLRLLPDAEIVLRKLMDIHPNDPHVHIQLGRVLAAEGKKDEATAQLEAGTKTAPGDAAIERDLASLYADTGKYDKAEPLYHALLNGNPDDAELHDDIGKALLKQHKFPEAQQEFMAAVRLKPDFGAAYGDLAVAANENKNYELAIKAADSRARFLPEIPISYFFRATAYDHLRDKKNAVLNYHRFLDVANGKYPDQEWQARERLKAIESK
jgi:tetratricopeptide (TPR) repeat protein